MTLPTLPHSAVRRYSKSPRYSCCVAHLVCLSVNLVSNGAGKMVVPCSAGIVHKALLPFLSHLQRFLPRILRVTKGVRNGTLQPPPFKKWVFWKETKYKSQGGPVRCCGWRSAKRRWGSAAGSMHCSDKSRNNDHVPALHLLGLQKLIWVQGYRQEDIKQKLERNWETSGEDWGKEMG